MNWQETWSQFATSSHNPLLQVGRTVNGEPMSEALLDEIVADIVRKTNMQMTDNVLDVCCGNGILTQKLAKYCAQIIGIDSEKELIERAKKDFSGENIRYFEGDALAISTKIEGEFQVIVLYFSFQYFDSLEKGKKVLSEMRTLLPKKGCILLGDVPDGNKITVFYPNLLHRIRYYISCFTGKNAMGKFWKAPEIIKIAKELQLNVQVSPQKESLPYSYYRSDYLLFPANT